MGISLRSIMQSANELEGSTLTLFAAPRLVDVMMRPNGCEGFRAHAHHEDRVIPKACLLSSVLLSFLSQRLRNLPLERLHLTNTRPIRSRPLKLQPRLNPLRSLL